MRRWEIFVFACLIASHDVASAQTADGYNRAAKLLLDAIDESKNPCDDFYEFSCGKWSTTNALKEGEQLRDSFSSAAKKVDQDMTVLLAECSYGGSKAINAVKMFYDTCMNKDRQQPKKSYEVIHHLVNFGYWPIIQPKWNAADYDLTQLLIHVAKAGAPTHLVTLKVEQNFKDSMQKVLMVEQDKPTLETAYLGQSEEEKKFVEFYERNLNEIVAILAKDAGSCRTAVEIAADVRGIADFERRLAEINEQDDPGADLSEASNLMKLSELAILLPAINWQHLLREVLPPEARSFVGTDPLVNVLNPNFVQRLNRLLQNTGPRVVTNYVLYRYVMDFKDSLDGRFDAILDRTRLPKTRHETCAAEVQNLLPQAAGAMYVRRHFTQTDAQVVAEQMQDLRKAFGEIIQASTWMDAATKQYAYEKLQAMEFNIGAPDYAYSDEALDDAHPGVSLRPTDSYATMLRKLQVAAQSQQMSLLPTRKSQRKSFNMSPLIPNAYNDLFVNAVFMMAATLQGPFFDKEFPKSVNYGSTGQLVGHELTHGFDNRGALYGKDGSFRRWWDPTTYQTFLTRKQCIIDQYTKFRIPELGGTNVDGVLTQGENVADNGGLKEAYMAYREHVRKRGQEEAPLPGLEKYTQDQIFFMAFGRAYCQNDSPQTAELLRVGDTHSPGRFRVLGTLMNSEEFAKAFSCPPGSPMNPAHKCVVW